MKFHAPTLDREILRALATRVVAPTYVIRNILIWPGAPFHGHWLRTSHVLTACRRLERKGLIKEAPTSYAVMKNWQITEAGRVLAPSPEAKGGPRP